MVAGGGCRAQRRGVVETRCLDASPVWRRLVLFPSGSPTARRLPTHTSLHLLDRSSSAASDPGCSGRDDAARHARCPVSQCRSDLAVLAPVPAHCPQVARFLISFSAATIILPASLAAWLYPPSPPRAVSLSSASLAVARRAVWTPCPGPASRLDRTAPIRCCCCCSMRWTPGQACRPTSRAFVCPPRCLPSRAGRVSRRPTPPPPRLRHPLHSRHRLRLRHRLARVPASPPSTSRSWPVVPPPSAS